MLKSVYQLINEDIRVPFGTATFEDMHFDPDTGQIRYIEVGVGGWLNTDVLLCDARRFSVPTHSDGLWTLSITEDERDAAPGWQGPTLLHALRAETWPPIIQGPFGHDTSPLLAYGRMTDFAGGPVTDRPNPDDLIDPLERVSEWKNLPVFGWDGELGTLFDLEFEPATRRFMQMSTLLNGSLVHIPYDKLRYRSKDGKLLTANARRSDFHEVQEMVKGS